MYTYINPILYQTSRYNLPALNHASSTNSFIKVQSKQIKKKMDKNIILIPSYELNKYIELYNWRAKTQLPIAKIFSYKILGKNVGITQMITLQVTYQTPITKLSQLKKIPFFQVLYLLKETLIGCQRLFNKFGGFKLTKDMVFLNKNHKCKVWINKNLIQNSAQIQVKSKDQKLFAISIYSLFQDTCIKSKQSAQFFNGIIQIYELAQAIQYTDFFAKQKKIIISNSLKLNDSLGFELPLTNTKKFNSQLELTSSKISTTNTSWINSSVQISRINQKNNEQILKSISNELECSQKSNKIQGVPKFLKKDSDLNKSTYTPPQFLKNKSNLKGSKSSTNIKGNMKHSALTRFVKKDPIDLSKSSYDCSLSQTHSTTPKSMKVCDRSQIINSKINPSTPTKSFDEKIPKKQISTSSFRLLKKKTLEISPFQQMGKQFQFLQSQNIQKEKERLRKFSNQFDPKVLNQFKGIKINSSPHLDQSNVSSLQSPQSPIPSITILPCIQQSKQQKSNFNKVFQKNGWKFQIQSLIQNDISIRQSIKDGIQERCQTLGTTFDFAKLARLGRAIQGSMVPDEQLTNSASNF